MSKRFIIKCNATCNPTYVCGISGAKVKPVWIDLFENIEDALIYKSHNGAVLALYNRVQHAENYIKKLDINYFEIIELESE